MLQWQRVHTALAENPSLVPGTHGGKRQPSHESVSTSDLGESPNCHTYAVVHTCAYAYYLKVLRQVFYLSVPKNEGDVTTVRVQGWLCSRHIRKEHH